MAQSEATGTKPLLRCALAP